MDSSELKAQGDPSKGAPHSPELSLQAAPRFSVKTGAAPLACDSQGSSHRDTGLDAPRAGPAGKGEGVLRAPRHLPSLAASEGLGSPEKHSWGSRGPEETDT